MLQLNYIRDNKEDVLKRLAVKNFKDAESIINSVIDLDNNRKATQKQADDTKAEANGLARQIGDLMKAGSKEEAEKLKTRTTELKETEKQLDDRLRTIEQEVYKLLVTVPNLPSAKVPVGRTAEDNEVVFEHGAK